jgi:hypothetical protein
VFSFCVDLAQRLIGFLVNASAFVTVPTAFRNEARAADSSFAITLLRGAVLAVALAFGSFVAVIGLWHSGWLSALARAPFDPGVFAIVSAAVVLNRVKKIVIDPFAMRALKAAAIALGYAVGAPLALALGFAAMRFEAPRGAEIAYLCGYAIAALSTMLLLRPALGTRAWKR